MDNMESNILLENGTNELEILEFLINGNHYGINVEKVREILTYQEVTPIPNAHPCIEGIFAPRGDVITVIDLFKALGFDNYDKKSNYLVITNFNNLHIAFDVQMVLGIKRVSWTDVIKPDVTVSGPGTGVATGIIKTGKDLLIILDFERIVEEICPETGLKISDIEALSERERNNIPILVAEDSQLLCKLIQDSLNTAGYNNVKITNNGQEAWDYLLDLKKQNGVAYGAKCVITDIEMPQMNGHRLLKLIRETDGLKHIPVVVFSSLINEDMMRKGEALGANAQVSKPEIGKLVSILDSLLQE